jgi:hypothetical protein
MACVTYQVFQIASRLATFCPVESALRCHSYVGM